MSVLNNLTRMALAAKQSNRSAVQGDYSQNDETAADYIKNRPFYENYQKTALLEQTEIDFSSGGYSMEEAITKGVTYSINWDGTEYTIEAVSKEIIAGEIYVPYLEQENGLFSIEGSYVSCQDNGIHTVAIYTSETVIKPIDEKFIPKTIARESSGIVRSIWTQTPDKNGWISKLNYDCILNPPVISSGHNGVRINNLDFITKSGNYSLAAGYKTTASGNYSHTEGANTTASGLSSHAEGGNFSSYGYNNSNRTITASSDTNISSDITIIGSTAQGIQSHAEGSQTLAYGYSSHAEGNCTTASGSESHAEGLYTTASGHSQHVQGRFNIKDTESKYAHIVGNGTASTGLSNAHTLDWDGNAWFAGSVEGTAIILKSSSDSSSKRFRITVDDSGVLIATEV